MKLAIPGLMTADEISRQLGIPKAWILRQAKAGKIPFVRFSQKGPIYFAMEAIKSHITMQAYLPQSPSYPIAEQLPHFSTQLMPDPRQLQIPPLVEKDESEQEARPIPS